MGIQLAKLWKTSHDARLNLTLVSAAQYSEESLLGPVGVPAVCNKPILYVIVDAPADHLDSVTAHRWSRVMLIDARLVAEKVLVDAKCRLHGAMRNNLGLNLLLERLDRVHIVTKVLVRLVRVVVLLYALVQTLGRM